MIVEKSQSHLYNGEVVRSSPVKMFIPQDEVMREARLGFGEGLVSVRPATETRCCWGVRLPWDSGSLGKPSVFQEPWASQVTPVVKQPACHAGDKRDVGSIPGSERSPGGGHGNPLQCSWIEDGILHIIPWTEEPGGLYSLHRVTKSQIQLKRLSMHAYSF